MSVSGGEAVLAAVGGFVAGLLGMGFAMDHYRSHPNEELLLWKQGESVVCRIDVDYPRADCEEVARALGPRRIVPLKVQR